MILFQGCDPEATSEFAFFSQIEDCVPKPLVTFLSFRISGQVWNIALFPPHELLQHSAFFLWQFGMLKEGDI